MELKLGKPIQQQKRYTIKELVKMEYVQELSALKIKNIDKNPIQANLANGLSIVIDGQKKLDSIMKAKGNGTA